MIGKIRLGRWVAWLILIVQMHVRASQNLPQLLCIKVELCHQPNQLQSRADIPPNPSIFPRCLNRVSRLLSLRLLVVGRKRNLFFLFWFFFFYLPKSHFSIEGESLLKCFCGLCLCSDSPFITVIMMRLYTNFPPKLLLQ